MSKRRTVEPIPVYEAVMVGAVVEGSIARQFTEKCKPYATTDVIEAFIHSVINGDMEVSTKSYKPTNSELLEGWKR